MLALKGNQGTLHQAVIDHIDEQLDGDLENAREHVTIEKGHGREETRTYIQLPAPEDLPGFTSWKGLKSIGIATSQCLRDGKETTDVRYYISVSRWTSKYSPMRPELIGELKIPATGVWTSPIVRMSRAYGISTCVKTSHGSGASHCHC